MNAGACLLVEPDALETLHLVSLGKSPTPEPASLGLLRYFCGSFALVLYVAFANISYG